MDRMKFETPDLTAENIAKLAELFPGVVADGKVNVDLLRSYVGEEIFGDEAYEFTWVGKRAAIAEAGRPIRKTLRPCIEESKNWDTTENLYIEGDNLDVLKLLQESYLGKVKIIYIDPPYNTGNDFIYRDNLKQSREDYEDEAGMYDEDGNRFFRNTETNGRFHSDWCSMVYPRLVLARNLLRDDGVIYISIDDIEVAGLRKICDEIFGVNNFVCEMIWQSTAGSNTGTDIVTVTEYILTYTKKRSAFKFDGMLSNEDNFTLSDEYEPIRGRYSLDKLDRRRVGNHYSEALNYAITMPDGTPRYPGGGSVKSEEGWNYLWSKTKVEWGVANGFVEFKKVNDEWNAYNKRYLKVDNEGNPVERSSPFRNLITSDKYNTAQGTAELRNLFNIRPFDFPKPSGLIKYLLTTALRTDSNSIILDFFSGSATTAHAVMQLNAEDSGRRKFIMVQLPEVCAEGTEAAKAGCKNICEIGKERIRRAGEKIAESVGADLRVRPSADTEQLQTNDGQPRGVRQTHDEGQTHRSAPTAVDVGFRVLKLDDTNMNDVYYAATETTQDMLSLFESNIKPDRTDMDLLFGCLLDWGLPLSMPHANEVIDGATVHTYNGGDLIACFAEKISDTVVKEIAKRQPLRAVFRDSSFTSSPEKINVAEIFKLLAPNTTVRVI